MSSELNTTEKNKRKNKRLMSADTFSSRHLAAQ